MSNLPPLLQQAKKCTSLALQWTCAGLVVKCVVVAASGHLDLSLTSMTVVVTRRGQAQGDSASNGGDLYLGVHWTLVSNKDSFFLCKFFLPWGNSPPTTRVLLRRVCILTGIFSNWTIFVKTTNYSKNIYPFCSLFQYSSTNVRGNTHYLRC